MPCIWFAFGEFVFSVRINAWIFVSMANSEMLSNISWKQVLVRVTGAIMTIGNPRLHTPHSVSCQKLHSTTKKQSSCINLATYLLLKWILTHPILTAAVSVYCSTFTMCKHSDRTCLVSSAALYIVTHSYSNAAHKCKFSKICFPFSILLPEWIDYRK